MEQQKETMSKPKVSASAQRELDKAEKKFDDYQEQIKSISSEVGRDLPVRENESNTRLSSKEIAKKNEIYLKPERHLSDNQKFNEKFREEWNFQKEYVNFIAEHKEIIGDVIEMWTHPFGGVGAQFWKIPTNKPIWAPRYVAEQLKSKRYVRYVTQNHTTTSEGNMQFYGGLVAETQIQRLDANPVSTSKSVFMGSSGF